MSITITAKVARAEEKAGTRKRWIQALARGRRSSGTPFSPIASILMLLAVGALVKSGPAIHALLGQN